MLTRDVERKISELIADAKKERERIRLEIAKLEAEERKYNDILRRLCDKNPSRAVTGSDVTRKARPRALGKTFNKGVTKALVEVIVDKWSSLGKPVADANPNELREFNVNDLHRAVVDAIGRSNAREMEVTPKSTKNMMYYIAHVLGCGYRARRGRGSAGDYGSFIIVRDRIVERSKIYDRNH